MCVCGGGGGGGGGSAQGWSDIFFCNLLLFILVYLVQIRFSTKSRNLHSMYI